MMLTYQYKLNPIPEQVVIVETWGELLRRHWNYALGERLDWLRRTRSQIDRCSLVSEVIGEIPDKPDYYTQASNLKQTKEGASQFLELVITHIFLKKGDRPKIGLQNPDASVGIFNRLSQMRIQIIG